MGKSTYRMKKRQAWYWRRKADDRRRKAQGSALLRPFVDELNLVDESNSCNSWITSTEPNIMKNSQSNLKSFWNESHLIPWKSNHNDFLGQLHEFNERLRIGNVFFYFKTYFLFKLNSKLNITKLFRVDELLETNFLLCWFIFHLLVFVWITALVVNQRLKKIKFVKHFLSQSSCSSPSSR